MAKIAPLGSVFFVPTTANKENIGTMISFTHEDIGLEGIIHQYIIDACKPYYIVRLTWPSRFKLWLKQIKIM